MTILGLCFDGSARSVAIHHDPVLVALSYIVAVLASFTGLEMCERLRGAKGLSRWSWLAAGSVALGGGVWSMHFIGMLAFRIPIPEAYDPVLTIVSGLAAVAAVAVGLRLIQQSATLARVAGAGLLVGLGMVTMHYCGMGALDIPGRIYYRPDLFAISVIIAVSAATLALWLATTLKSTWQRGLAALVMAAAICGMHYVGMAATVIVAGPVELRSLAGALHGETLAAAVLVSVLIILCLGLGCTFVDRRIERRAVREAEHLRALNITLAERTDSLLAAMAEVDDARNAEAVTKAKTELLSSMSHELRTPLNGVLGFAHVMRLNQAREPLTERQAQAVEQIILSGDHLLQLIEAMLELARLNKGEASAIVSRFDPGETLAEITAALAPAASLAGVTIAIRAPEPRCCAVVVDRERLRQALTNILSNAIKYNHPGGEVVAQIRAVGGQVEIVVSDTGIGIPPEMLAKLFQSFNRLGHEGSAILGAGIGLVIAKRLVEAMKGELRVESVEDVGSTFTLVIPAAPREIRRLKAA